MDAFLDSAVDAGNYYATRSHQIAAALRAAADQVVPKPIRLPRNSYAEGAYDQRIIDHQQLRAIATELEGQ
jgi:Arc/MetJ-type ribon-helix-helix transcriptional regulator